MNKFITTIIPFKVESIEEKVQTDSNSQVSTETIHSDTHMKESSELVEKDNNSMIQIVSTKKMISSSPFIPTQSSSISPSILFESTASISTQSTPSPFHTTSPSLTPSTSTQSTPSQSISPSPSPSLQPCGDNSNPCLLVLTLSAEVSKVYFSLNLSSIERTTRETHKYSENVKFISTILFISCCNVLYFSFSSINMSTL